MQEWIAIEGDRLAADALLINGTTTDYEAVTRDIRELSNALSEAVSDGRLSETTAVDTLEYVDKVTSDGHRPAVVRAAIADALETAKRSET